MVKPASSKPEKPPGPAKASRPEKPPKPPKPPNPWPREGPGRYRSADGRFTIEQSGQGRWFAIDGAAQDDLGLPRTLGPYATLDDAREAAEGIRGAPPEDSPLKARIAEAARRPKVAEARPARAASDSHRRDRADPGPGAVRATPPLPPPPPPTWIDRLEPDRASRVRLAIAELERLGIAESERIVRADEESGEPAIASALLARRVEVAAIAPWSEEVASGTGKPARDPARAEVRRLIDRARAAGLSDDEARDLLTAVARAAAAAALGEVAEREGDPDARGLPGWRLVERNPADPERRRRIHRVEGDQGKRQPLRDSDR